MRVVATAGHVDHGKSSLVQALTGTDPDRLEEEKRRGLTIDLGFAHTTLASGAGISFVDVPGHVRFIANMLAGVGAVDACLFVVDAAEGWRRQSEEHLRILELLGVHHGVVALTKIDALVDRDGPSTADERAGLIELATLDVAEHVERTFLAGAPIVAVSAVTGDGIDELRLALDDLVAATPAAADRGRPRLWIDRVFAARGSGTVVTGTLTGGALRRDAQLVVEPGRRAVRVRAIQTLGRAVEQIGPGHRVALNLSGVDHTSLARGDAVVQADRWWSTDRFDASLTVLVDHDVTRRGAFAVHIGSGEHAAQLRVLGTKSIGAGATGNVRFRLPHPLPLLPGDRFVLRESGRGETVGGGEVLDVDPVLPAGRAAPDRRIERVIAERGWVDVDTLERLTGERRAATHDRWVVDPRVAAAAAAEVSERVDAAGPLGLDVAALDERQRAVLAGIDGIEIDSGRARPVASPDALGDHPVIEALAAGGLTPPSVDGLADPAARRDLARRGVLVERDGLWFHADAIGTAAMVAAGLLVDRPAGFTVGEFRVAAGISRKYALPLLNELDARGITRRRDDHRIAGPRLPGSPP